MGAWIFANVTESFGVRNGSISDSENRQLVNLKKMNSPVFGRKCLSGIRPPLLLPGVLLVLWSFSMATLSSLFRVLTVYFHSEGMTNKRATGILFQVSESFFYISLTLSWSLSLHFPLTKKNEVYPRLSYCFRPFCFHWHCFRTTHDVYPVSSSQWFIRCCPYHCYYFNSYLLSQIVQMWLNANLSLYRGVEECVRTQYHLMLNPSRMLNLISLLQFPSLWYVMMFSTWK